METVIKNGWYGTPKKVWITGKCLHAGNHREVWTVGCLRAFMYSVKHGYVTSPALQMAKLSNELEGLRGSCLKEFLVLKDETANHSERLFTYQIFFTIIAIFFIQTEEMVEPQGQKTKMSKSSTWTGRLVDRDWSDALLYLVTGIKMTIIISQTFVLVSTVMVFVSLRLSNFLSHIIAQNVPGICRFSQMADSKRAK